MYGYTADEVIGKPVTILAPPDRRAEVSRSMADASQGIMSRYETIRLAKGGRAIDVAIAVSAIRQADQGIVGVAVIMRDIGRHVLAERRLRDSEARFRSAFENAPSGLCLTDPDGRFLQVNTALCQMLGYEEDELLRAGWPRLTHPDDRGVSVGMTEHLRADPSRSVEAEKRYLRRGGGTVWARTRVSQVSEAGQPSYYIAHIEDITSRKHAEHAHEFQHSVTRAIHHVSLDGILVVNEGNVVVSYNEQFLHVWRIAASDLPEGALDQVHRIPDPFKAVVVGRVNDSEAFVRRIQELNNDPEATDHCEIELKDGRTIERYSTCLRSDSGSSLGRVWFFRDVTTRKEADQALQRSEEQFRQLAENVHDVFWTMNAEATEVTYVSPAYEQVWGRTRDELYRNPMSWRQAIHPDDVERARDAFDRQIAGEQVASEYRIRMLDRTEKWVREAAFPVRDQAGTLVRVVGVAEDVTSQKRYEDQLVRARAAADAANMAKSRLLANMSHEIRTPMNGVIGMLQLLLQSELTPEQRAYAGVIEISGRTLLALINDILDLSKIEAGMVSLEQIDFDPRSTVDQLLDAFRLEASRKGLIFGGRVMPDVPARLRGDSNRLRQVLNNLVANAVKFTERGTVSLLVTADGVVNGRVLVRFKVSDTGIGVRPDQAQALFSPFVQADVSTTRKYGGTGLGLAIARQLVELMGGTIGLESAEGRGSTFWFTAALDTVIDEPVVAPTPSAAAAPAVSEEDRIGTGPLTAPVSRPDVRILLAEDNKVNQVVALALLKKLGYRVDLAVDGVKAVTALQERRYDLVLMDCEMPNMDGYEATRRIRESGEADMPIIAVTAHAMAGDSTKCLHAGMNDFLSKPIDMTQLAEVCARWLPPAAVPGSADHPRL